MTSEKGGPEMAVSIQHRRIGKRRAGFTLIELLVVVVIIGILASTAMPSFVGAQDKARNAAVVANMNNIRTALESYAAEHNSIFPDNPDFTTATGLGAYFPGGKLPLSPWSTLPQANRIMPDITPVLTLEYYTADPTLARPASSSSFVPATPGQVGDPPSLMTHFGAIASDCTDGADRTTYVLYGIGKKGKNCIVAGSCSNFGR
jgi:prepilin-type N-terminal cleavage/methylation domain-containing protein